MITCEVSIQIESLMNGYIEKNPNEIFNLEDNLFIPKFLQELHEKLNNIFAKFPEIRLNDLEKK